jgi:DNA-binding MarR family transcriptional regulator
LSLPPYGDKPFGFLIHKAGQGFFNALLRSFKPYDISPEQWGIMNQLWHKDGLTQKELASRMIKDQTNLGRLLDKLEAKGYIERRRPPNDRRAYLIYLTEAGYGLKDILKPLAFGIQETLLEGLSEEETAVLRRSLLQMIENAEKANAELIPVETRDERERNE